jgi:hypothetical protein
LVANFSLSTKMAIDNPSLEDIFNFGVYNSKNLKTNQIKLLVHKYKVHSDDEI